MSFASCSPASCPARQLYGCRASSTWPTCSAKTSRRPREAWIEEKGISTKGRERRQQSDFLAAVNHQGERAVFYSTRHAHGSALAAAGVPEKDIAASMHHASRATTKRYLHSRQPELVRAVAALPDVAYAPQVVAPGRKRKVKRAG